MKERIYEVLPQLDPENENHWTADGLPRIETVEALVGDKVTRSEIREAAPYFNRKHPSFDQPVIDEGSTNIWDAPELTGDGSEVETQEPEQTEVKATEDPVVVIEEATLEQADHAVEVAMENVAKAQATLVKVQKWRDGIAVLNAPEPETNAQVIKRFQQSQQEQAEREHEALTGMFKNVPDSIKQMLLNE